MLNGEWRIGILLSDTVLLFIGSSSSHRTTEFGKECSI